ncbi:MAG: ferrous iron transport protein A [Oscillospiraceae bacterium]|nr:ferrous iron transport protein A [Oscillospiraceae bacterium]
MYLHELEVGAAARVVSVRRWGAMGRRLRELGLIEGETVACVGVSPLGDPRAYRICGAVIALRNVDAACVEVEA